MTEEEFIVYSAEMDAETINQDFDEIDLYGERKLGDNDNDDDCNINFEWTLLFISYIIVSDNNYVINLSVDECNMIIYNPD